MQRTLGVLMAVGMLLFPLHMGESRAFLIFRKLGLLRPAPCPTALQSKTCHQGKFHKRAAIPGLLTTSHWGSSSYTGLTNDVEKEQRAAEVAGQQMGSMRHAPLSVGQEEKGQEPLRPVCT